MAKASDPAFARVPDPRTRDVVAAASTASVAPRARRPISFDASTAPLLRFAIDGPVSPDALRGCLADYGRFLDKGLRHGVVFDGLRSNAPSPLLRRILSDWTYDESPRLRELCVGFAFVFTSPLIRGALTAIIWVRPLPYASMVVTTIDEGDAWVRARLS